MRRRFLAVATALTCSAIFLAGPAALVSGSADDGNAKGKAAGADLFGLTKVVKLHIEISAEEYQAMQPSPRPASGRSPAGPEAEAPGEREQRAEPLRVRVLLGARGPDCGGQDLQGRGPPLFGKRLVHGVGGGPEALVPGRSGVTPTTRISTGSVRLGLQSGALDPAKARESLAFALFREAGVPAPRTAHGRGRRSPSGPPRQGLSRSVHPRRARGPRSS